MVTLEYLHFFLLLIIFCSYDFFIARFSQMCHSDNSSPGVRDSLRIAGLRGIHGVVRKSVNEDLADNIWESKHMNLIIPSLLFNLGTGWIPTITHLGL